MGGLALSVEWMQAGWGEGQGTRGRENWYWYVKRLFEERTCISIILKIILITVVIWV